MASGDPRLRPPRPASRIQRPGGNNAAKTRGDTQQQPGDKDTETIAYVKRVLCSDKTRTPAQRDHSTASTSLDELLPPLTSSNDVDIQLYAIIAVVLDQFVQSWYQRITIDHDFIDEIINIIAHCTRGIEQRLKHLDLQELLLDELPALFCAHIEAFTVALSACSDERPSSDARHIFHSIRPNPALTPPPDNPTDAAEQQENESAWAQLLVSRILPLVLPPEDLQNPCLHVLVSEVFSQIILCNAVLGRGSEAWVIWEGVTKLIKSLTQPSVPSPEAQAAQPVDRLQQFGLLSSAGDTTVAPQLARTPRRIDVVTQGFWSMLQTLSLGWLILRTVIGALMHESSIPPRSIRRPQAHPTNKLSLAASHDDAHRDPSLQPTLNANGRAYDDKPAVVEMRVWTCVARLAVLERRMPWLHGLVSLVQWLVLNGPGKVCRLDGALDRLLASKINEAVTNPALLPRLLSTTRSALFPNNALAPARQPPTTAEELQLIKCECADTILAALPPFVRSKFFATSEVQAMRDDVECSLDLFADAYVNKHLLVGVLGLLVVRAFPELGEEGGEE